MKHEDFINCVKNKTQPDTTNMPLLALWQDAMDNWDGAHDSCQIDKHKNGAWVHAYLHRKEGDIGNASYWYNSAGKSRPNCSLQDEWHAIAKTLCD